MRATCALLVLTLWLVAVSPANGAGRRCGDDVDGRAVPCACGDVLVSSRTLSAADPITHAPCPHGGLLVAVPADDEPATLDLGGLTLAGSRRGVGIQVVSGGAGGLTIAGPGTVRGFAVGVAARGALAAVRDVASIDNGADGFRLTGDGYRVTNCEAARTGRVGFALTGRNFQADGNRAFDNARTGISVAGAGARIGEVRANDAASNRRGGVAVQGARVRARAARRACDAGACR
jgi:hypothetical protein